MLKRNKFYLEKPKEMNEYKLKLYIFFFRFLIAFIQNFNDYLTIL